MLAAAECYPAREGARGRLGRERNWFDGRTGMDMPPSAVTLGG